MWPRRFVAILRVVLVCAIMVCLAQSFRGGTAWADAKPDPTRMMLDVPRQGVVMGDDIGRTDWSTRLAHPSNEGQFEVLVRKSATSIRAPACKSDYLVIRMPASVSIGPDPATQAEVARKRRYYAQLLSAYDQGEPLRAEVFAGPYGKRDPDGRLELTQCNLFFVEPVG
jgi:hypothetical protein